MRGQLNNLVDDLCHPFFKENPGFMLANALVRGLIEKDLLSRCAFFLKWLENINSPK